jgi:hypothetical protein
MTSAGGFGSGSANGNATGAIDTLSAYAASIDALTTGVFTGEGYGSDGNDSNQPYTGGSINGKGSGAGSARVSGLAGYEDPGPSTFSLQTSGDATFSANGVGGGFVDSTNGGAFGSASADVFGATAGKTAGTTIDGVYYRPPDGDFSFRGSSTSNGKGEFAGGFSPTQSSGPTGGSASSKGSFNVAGAASGIPEPSLVNRPFFVGSAAGSGTAQTAASGSATGFNDLGSWGLIRRVSGERS